MSKKGCEYFSHKEMLSIKNDRRGELCSPKGYADTIQA